MRGFEDLVADRIAGAAGRWLGVGVDLTPALPGASTWWRTAIGGRPASPFPPEGPWDGAVVRLPRGKEESATLLELCAARLAPGGELWAGGPQAEGSRGIGRRLSTWLEEVEPEVYGGHARAARARRPRAGLRRDGDAFREEVPIRLPSGPDLLASWPGLFAHGRLDAGTELLLGALPSASGRRVLDVGCGAGALGRALSGSGPASLDLCDVDALAVRAARLNVPGARVTLCDGVPAGGGTWDLVVSNPPLHLGAELDAGLVPRLAEGLRGRVDRGGEVWLVTHATVPVERAFQGIVRRFQSVERRSPYVVWRLTA